MKKSFNSITTIFLFSFFCFYQANGMQYQSAEISPPNPPNIVRHEEPALQPVPLAMRLAFFEAWFNIIDYLVELNRLAGYQSKNTKHIEFSIVTSLIKTGIRSIIDISKMTYNTKEYFRNNLIPQHYIIKLSLSIIPNLFLHNIYKHEKNIYNNAEKISKVNSENVTSNKIYNIKQISWLTLNHFLPFLVVGLKIKRDGNNLRIYKDMLCYTESEYNLTAGDYLKMLNFLQDITNISESLRKNARNKWENKYLIKNKIFN